jgi:hypothetical protein
VNLRPTSKRSRTALLALVAATLVTLVMAAAVPTYSLNSRQTGRLDSRGFPLFYTDDGGVRLRLCETGTAQCQRATRRALTPPGGENFYWMATAHIRTSQGPIDVELALEAAFGGPRGHLPVVFQRIRIRGHLDQRGGYVLDHPYGSTNFRAITPVEQRNVDFTSDRACSRKRTGTCNGFITNFLRATNPPKGYVGFGGRRTLVRGGTFRNDMVVRTDTGVAIGQTDRIAVLGKRFFRRAR